MNLAVVDDGGHLIAFGRMDGARPASVATSPGPRPPPPPPIPPGHRADRRLDRPGRLRQPTSCSTLSLQNASGGKITTLPRRRPDRRRRPGHRRHRGGRRQSASRTPRSPRPASPPSSKGSRPSPRRQAQPRSPRTAKPRRPSLPRPRPRRRGLNLSIDWRRVCPLPRQTMPRLTRRDPSLEPSSRARRGHHLEGDSDADRRGIVRVA